MIRVIGREEIGLDLRLSYLRVYAYAHDFLHICVESVTAIEARGRTGVFVATDEPQAFARGEKLPGIVLQAMTEGAPLVTATGDDLYAGGEVSLASFTKVIVKGDPHAFVYPLVNDDISPFEGDVLIHSSKITVGA